MTVQLAMYKGKGTAANSMIRWWNDSIYSHCELVIDGIAYSSSLRDGGVRSMRFEPSDKWDLIEVPWADEKKVIAFFFLTNKQYYGVLDLISRQILKLPTQDGESKFCSEWCAAALGIPNARDYAPQGLLDLVTFINQKIR